MILPAGTEHATQARESLDEALMLSDRLAPGQAEQVIVLARSAFDYAFVGVIVAAALLLVSVSLAVRWKTSAR